ncbi:uncharacterized protein LOC130495523 [Raphanus sativus]|uniref:Uncharacterized protein LOC130495523 n=1 Tax=Raphanus sativus TaxID=3726 RepID=A0A9W3BUJ6_RAPSA|nr:uncharacterized protein LOC130495523 [Raphanus sativus]
MEALTANIKKAENDKRLTGIKVARACPSISHMLFADDSLFFCRAQKEECQAILVILKEYEKVSGQQINFEKSSIQFSHKIDEDTRQELRDILGIQNRGGMGTYLGIPESLGGSKVHVFGFVQERLNNRVNGWTFKFFTKGGKESPSGNTKGLHWKSWDKVCLHKDDGGLGFRDLTDVNTAMLAKQLWRFIEKPNSLFSRVFKGRYFRNTSPLEPARSYSSSYGWRSIISARSLEIMEPADVKIVESIPLSRVQTLDREGWHFTKNGKYTVKSGYQLERAYPDRGNGIIEFGPTVTDLKAHCWKVRCPPKMKHFLWQLLSGCIAVRKNLKARGLKGDTGCDRCGADKESINHVFFECPPAVQVWALSKIPTNPDYFPGQSLFTNMDHLFWRIKPALDDDYFVWILWYIWKGRNNKVFSNLDIDPQDTLKLAMTESLLWSEAQRALIQTNQVPARSEPDLPIRSGRWCFTDGSWKSGDPFSGHGWYSTLPGFEGLLEEWPAFASYLEDIRSLKRSFHSSEIIHISRTKNKKADGLARGVRQQMSFTVHMDTERPNWFTESI